MDLFKTCLNHKNIDLLNFNNLTTELLEEIYEKQKNLTLELNDKLANLENDKLSYIECFEKYMETESKYSTIFSLLDFEVLHPNKEIREKSVELNKKLSSFNIEQSMRQDIYDKISHYYLNQFPNEKINLNQEQIKFIEKTMIGYKMMGLDLDEDNKKKVMDINKKISIYASDYGRNIANVNTEFLFELNELDGLDELWLSNRFDKDTNKYRVKLEYPDYIPIMEYCKIRETRKMMYEAMGSRCVDTNIPIILDTIELRKKKAELFGLKSHADYKLQNMMAKNSQNVDEFLKKLLDAVKPLVKSDKDKILKLSKELDGLNDINAWDTSYYSRIYIEKESGLNLQDLKNYFSIKSVTDGIFSIYQELLGLKFVDITEDNPEALYSQNIKLFCVFNIDDQQLTKPIGYFYLDLFPREGKYGHAAMFTFIRKSKYNLPISAIVCNFDPNSNVDFDNVETYFHEFGHLMHNMVSEGNISSLTGTNCQKDFVETPSQMFEEWCYSLEPFKKLVIPELIDTIDFNMLIKKINNQHKMMQGLFIAKQISYSLLDLAIHSETIPENTWDYYNNLNIDLFGWEISPKTNILANWSHMFGYDACYYGYLWSKVYAIDLFSFFESNPLDKKLGNKLRKEILSKGGIIDGLELLRNFMEREPNQDAYIQWLNG